ncbi:hypothetical protein L1787_05545 [Acuticoccus sp. M5D2P5]|uniref:hypothetical protein n=1 Tax=Acuticoccus kalidii TaxID=2910977 RepID=UPI001F27576D|nr:hypothetical protein [Acuticoccus kalidii]MCF3932877.1 hypothetical protein [Acuticoccus kalidii]
MRIYYCLPLTDSDGGILVHDFEVEIEGRLVVDPNECALLVDHVWKERDKPRAGGGFDTTFVDLMASRDATWRTIGLHIAIRARQDPDLLAEAMAAEGVVYIGKGANDPDGRFVDLQAEAA